MIPDAPTLPLPLATEAERDAWLDVAAHQAVEYPRLLLAEILRANPYYVPPGRPE